jgi:hypothetical protein
MVVIALGLASCGRIGFDESGAGSTDALSDNDGQPLDCPNIGDVCADGSIYAGMTADGNVRMYTEMTAEPLIYNGPWSFGTGSPPMIAVQAGLVSRVTGAANTIQIATGGPFEDADAGAPGVQPHSAANHCANLTSHGHDDWYLPALDELRVLYANSAAIGGFPTDELWASTEDEASPTDCALAIDFPAGTLIHFRAKFDYRRARCVRK